MTTDRKLEANRLNAQHSTGPKTKRGKKCARFNACTHGYFCRHLVLAGESEGRFVGIREKLLESFKPQNMAELLVVDRIVSATWKIIRLQESEAIAHGCYAKRARHRLHKRAAYLENNFSGEDDRTPQALKLREQAKTGVFPPSMALANTIAADGDQFERRLMYEQRLENSIHRSLRDLALLRKNAKQTSELPDSPFTGESVIRGVEQWCERLNERIHAQHQNAQNEPTEKSSLTDEQASICDDFSGAEENPPKATEEGKQDGETASEEATAVTDESAEPRRVETQLSNSTGEVEAQFPVSDSQVAKMPENPMPPDPQSQQRAQDQRAADQPAGPSLPLGCILALLLVLCSVARATTWDNSPGSIDLGGWSIVRDHDNNADVVLLGPPKNSIIVGSAAEPLTAFLFSPDFIFAKTGAGATEKCYVIERGWPTKRQTGDQTIVKLTGPITRAQLESNPTWNDEVSGMSWNVPRAPNGSIFWKKPGVVILYSLIILGPLILIVLVPIIVIVLVIRALRRKSKPPGAL